MVALVGRGRLWLRRVEPGSGGDRTCRRWGRRPSSVDCGLGELQRVGLRLPEGLGELGVSLYRRPRSVPAAMDKDAGEPPFCCSRATWRRLGPVGAFRRTPHCSGGRAGTRLWLGQRRPWQRLSERRWRLAVVALWGARRWLGQLCDEGGVGARWLRAGTDQNERGEAATRRNDSGTHTRAKHALWPRPEHARQVFGKMSRHARMLG